MAAYFFLLIPPCLLTSTALALWYSGTEYDSEIWRSIFSQSTHFPWGDGMILFLSSAPFFLCFFSGRTMDLFLGGETWIQTESALSVLLLQFWWCAVAESTLHHCAPASWNTFNNMSHELQLDLSAWEGKENQCKRVILMSFVMNYSYNQL